MTAFSIEELATWAAQQRVPRHLTDGHADPEMGMCSGSNSLAAQAVANRLRSCREARP